MLVFNCTKAASDFFAVKKNGKIISPIKEPPNKKIDDDLALPIDINNSEKKWQWVVHLIKVKGKNALIIVDHKTRFSITLTGIKKGDAEAFLNLFELHLTLLIQLRLTEANADQEFIEECLHSYYKSHETNAFYSRGDSSVQGHINDVAYYLKNTAADHGSVPEEEELLEFNLFTSQFFRKTKEKRIHFSPYEELIKFWLNEYSSLKPVEVEEFYANYKKERNKAYAAKYDLSMNLTEEEETIELEENNNFPSNVINLSDFRKK